MRITVVDPPAYTPPYDHSLCAALARRGHEVELLTSRFRHGAVPPAAGYRRTECFYRLAVGSAVAKAAQHPLDMLRAARRTRRSRVAAVHFQWMPIPPLDRRLVRAFPHPRVLTAHDLLPREAGDRGRAAALRAFRVLDAVVVHSDHGRARLIELGVPESRVVVIPHGAFDYLASLPANGAIDGLAGDLEGRKVVLCFGLVRPYKGVDVLIEAFASSPPEALLLVVGRALVSTDPLRRQASELGIADRVRFVSRFVADEELAALFRRADLVVLPYREIEQSGVLFTALAFGAPTIASAVGGFVEVGERHGALRLVPPADPVALGDALGELLSDDAARAGLSEAARRAAAGPYSWDTVAERTEELYERLAENSR
jgi:glycosyltransferase involved in cell wall biosynthesis